MPRRTNGYVYVGELIPRITKEQHAEFIRNYQKSILKALVERKLLTSLQYEQCIEELNWQRK